MPNDPKSVQQAVGQARDRARDAVGDTAETLKNKFGESADAISSVTTRTPNPIALVVGIAAAGFIAGLLLPLTDVERDRLEPIGDELAQRAADARDEIVAQGRQVVTETVTAARDSVQKHGQELADTLKTSADDLVTGPSAATGSDAKQPAATDVKATDAASKSDPSKSDPSKSDTAKSDTAKSDASKSDASKTREALEKSGVITPKGSGSAT